MRGGAAAVSCAERSVKVKSIKTRLIVVIIAVLIVGFGGMSLVSYQKTKGILLC